MQVVTSYKVKITGYNKIFEETLNIYREALAYLIEIVNTEWNGVNEIKGLKNQQRHIEQLVRR